jgi:hypothetical protein
MPADRKLVRCPATGVDDALAIAEQVSTDIRNCPLGDTKNCPGIDQSFL